MSKLVEYFKTDWEAMTLHDWIGTILTVAIFFLMVGLYIYVFHPKNKEDLESRRFITMEEDEDFDAEDKKQ